jgi:predicted transcriptional regulator
MTSSRGERIDDPVVGATAAQVRAEIARRRCSQTTIAAKLQLSQSAVSRRLAGDVAWSVSELVGLSELLDVPLSTLLAQASA